MFVLLFDILTSDLYSYSPFVNFVNKCTNSQLVKIVFYRLTVQIPVMCYQLPSFSFALAIRTSYSSLLILSKTGTFSLQYFSTFTLLNLIITVLT